MHGRHGERMAAMDRGWNTDGGAHVAGIGLIGGNGVQVVTVISRLSIYICICIYLYLYVQIVQSPGRCLCAYVCIKT